MGQPCRWRIASVASASIHAGLSLRHGMQLEGLAAGGEKGVAAFDGRSPPASPGSRRRSPGRSRRRGRGLAAPACAAWHRCRARASARAPKRLWKVTWYSVLGKPRRSRQQARRLQALAVVGVAERAASAPADRESSSPACGHGLRASSGPDTRGQRIDRAGVVVELVDHAQFGHATHARAPTPARRRGCWPWWTPRTADTAAARGRVSRLVAFSASSAPAIDGLP